MLLNKKTTKLVLRESIRSPLYGVYDEFQIGAAMILEAETGHPYEIILEEGWFTDKLKSVGDFLKKNVSEPAKYAWAKHMPELYGQQTYKFWKRDEMRKAAEKQFEEVIDGLQDEADENWSKIYGDIKKQVGELKNVPKGELPFPNMKSTDEFYTQLFGASKWEDCEKIFDALEKGGDVPPEFTQGLFGKMATAKIMFQNAVDASVAATLEDDSGTKEIMASSNKKLKGMRDILQKYAQDVKEIYQTFENKAFRDGYADMLLMEGEEESVGEAQASAEGMDEETKEKLAAKTEEIAQNLGISADRLSAMRARQSPIRPLIAAIVMGIVSAIGMKVGMDQLNASIDAYEKLIAGKEKDIASSLKVIEKEVIDPAVSVDVDVDRGFTQMLELGQKLTDPTGNYPDGFLTDKPISETIALAKKLGMSEDWWAEHGAQGKAGWELMVKEASKNPTMSTAKFFLQSSKMKSGKTLASPYGVKKGVMKLTIGQIKKHTVKVVKQTVVSGVGGYTIAGATAFGLPATLVGGIVAGGAAVGLLTVAAIRKWKGNRQKLLLQCLDALDDIKGPRPKAVEAQEELVAPLIDNPDVDIDPNLPPPDPEAPGPEFDPMDPEGGGGEEGDGGNEAEGCEQTEKGLVQFMQKYDKDKDFSNKPGDGKPKKMSTMFNGPQLDKKFKKLPADALQKDLDATARKYNELLNANIFTVSDDPEEVKKVAQQNSSRYREGAMLTERWAKLAGIIR